MRRARIDILPTLSLAAAACAVRTWIPASRGLEPALTVAQRAGKKSRIRSRHAKIANRRNDYLHKLSTRLVAEHWAIFVGNVNAASLAKTRMANSVLAADWSKFRTTLN